MLAVSRSYNDCTADIVLFGLECNSQLWVGAMEFWADLAHELMRLKSSKLPYFQPGLRAMTLIQSAL